MSQSFWDSETVSDPQGEEQPELDQQQGPELELPEPQPQEPVAEPSTLAVSANEFSGLEKRILRAVELVKRERQGRAAAEERAAQAESQLREQAPLVEQLRAEVNALSAERDSVRQRVESLLAQLDALEL